MGGNWYCILSEWERCFFGIWRADWSRKAPVSEALSFLSLTLSLYLFITKTWKSKASFSLAFCSFGLKRFSGCACGTVHRAGWLLCGFSRVQKLNKSLSKFQRFSSRVFFSLFWSRIWRVILTDFPCWFFLDVKWILLRPKRAQKQTGPERNQAR